MKDLFFTSLLSLSVWLPLAASTGSSEHLRQSFREPPKQNRILKIIHNWPDAPEQQDAVTRRLEEEGFGGVVCNVSFDRYLEDPAKWKAFERAARQAHDKGWSMWLYDESGYPSATAGGQTLKGRPEWEAEGILVADGRFPAGPVKLQLPPGDPVLAVAVRIGDGGTAPPAVQDLRGYVTNDNLVWHAPEGRWHVILATRSRLFDGTHAAMGLADKRPYPNLLLAEPTRRFLELTHDAYARRLGDRLPAWFSTTFTDEPSLMSLFLRRMPYSVLPWSSNLQTEFLRRRGYPFDMSMLAALVTSMGSGTEKVRADFWRTVGELVAENYFGQIQTWCRNHGLLSGGHLLAEEGLSVHVPLYGDFFGCLRKLDAPGIDCLTSVPGEVPWHIAKLAGSAAELENRSVVMCETSDHGQVYRGEGDHRPVRQVTEDEIRGTCNRLMVNGVNLITSYYSFRGLDTDSLRRLNEWVGRCSAMLTGGKLVSDIAVVLPTESLWAHFVPSRVWASEAAEAAEIENSCRLAADSLRAAGRDFTFIDSRCLAEATIGRGILKSGRSEWRMVLLPMVDSLPLRAWQNLERFVRAGGVVVGLRARPRNSELEFPSPEVERIGAFLFGPESALPVVKEAQRGGGGIFLPEGTEVLLESYIASVLPRDSWVSGEAGLLQMAHRRTAQKDIYFVVNDSPDPWSGRVSTSGRGTGERWNPATGAMEGFLGAKEPMALPGYGATFLVYDRCELARRLPLARRTAPYLSVVPLACSEPNRSEGEFVRGSLQKRAMAGLLPTEGGWWSADAMLTKSGVDTFQFVGFPVLGRGLPAEAQCVVVDTWVPEGQETPVQLLFILRERGGADYLANTSCMLAKPGYRRNCVPLSRFQVAGWSKDTNGKLDLNSVQELRVGWGGYFGKEGETVSFVVASPNTGAVVIPATAGKSAASRLEPSAR